MPRKSLEHLECAVANTMEVIGDAWTFLVLRDAFLGVRRFDEFVTDLGISRNILTDRLNGLIEAEILEARPYSDRPVRYEYRLSEKGKDLFDALMVLWSFGEKWTPPAEPDHQRVIHATCGNEALAVAHCSHCGERLNRREVRIEPPLTIVAQRTAQANT